MDNTHYPRLSYREDRGRSGKQSFSDGIEVGSLLVQLLNEYRGYSFLRGRSIMEFTQRFAQSVFRLSNEERFNLWRLMKSAIETPTYNDIQKALDVIDRLAQRGASPRNPGHFLRQYLGAPWSPEPLTVTTPADRIADHVISIGRERRPSAYELEQIQMLKKREMGDFRPRFNKPAEKHHE